jgi:hypothetical protein
MSEHLTNNREPELSGLREKPDQVPFVLNLKNVLKDAHYLIGTAHANTAFFRIGSGYGHSDYIRGTATHHILIREILSLTEAETLQIIEHIVELIQSSERWKEFQGESIAKIHHEAALIVLHLILNPSSSNIVKEKAFEKLIELSTLSVIDQVEKGNMFIMALEVLAPPFVKKLTDFSDELYISLLSILQDSLHQTSAPTIDLAHRTLKKITKRSDERPALQKKAQEVSQAITSPPSNPPLA